MQLTQEKVPGPPGLIRTSFFATYPVMADGPAFETSGGTPQTWEPAGEGLGGCKAPIKRSQNRHKEQCVDEIAQLATRTSSGLVR